MIGRAINDLEPDKGKNDSKTTHDPENRLPVDGCNKPAHEGSEKYGREIRG